MPFELLYAANRYTFYLFIYSCLLGSGHRLLLYTVAAPELHYSASVSQLGEPNLLTEAPV